MNFVFNDAKPNPENANDVEYIQNLPLSVIYESAKILNRLPEHVYKSWRGFIKPTLLSYHNCTLLTDIKSEFFKYIVEKKAHSVQDIDWPDVVKLFPGQNPTSLGSNLRIKHFEKIPLCEAIKDRLANLKNSRQNQSNLKRRQQLIFLYDKAKGVLNDDVTGAGCFSKIRILI
jgi:hypothetical protein